VIIIPYNNINTSFDIWTFYDGISWFSQLFSTKSNSQAARCLDCSVLIPWYYHADLCHQKRIPQAVKAQGLTVTHEHGHVHVCNKVTALSTDIQITQKIYHLLAVSLIKCWDGIVFISSANHYSLLRLNRGILIKQLVIWLCGVPLLTRIQLIYCRILPF
jgi:hypothetical protein